MKLEKRIRLGAENYKSGKRGGVGSAFTSNGKIVIMFQRVGAETSLKSRKKTPQKKSEVKTGSSIDLLYH